MVKWLLLLAVLAAFCFSADATRCYDARPSWSPTELETCEGEMIDIKNETIDVSTWTEDDLKKVFNTKTLDGGLAINKSQIVGKDIYFNVNIQKSKPQIPVIVENNPNLEEFFMEFSPNSAAPYVRVSGNRKLKKDSILVLEELKENKAIRKDSHIQAYHECDLGGATVRDVKTTLDGCSAVYGDLVFDGNSKFPADLATIEPLKYVQGCLRITGTNFKSWNEITFLEKTKPLGGCTTGHKISGNTNMCIQPPVAHKLDLLFKGITISSNMNCTAECSNGYLQQTADSTCVIITDSLIIGAKTQLPALNNVEEIRGLLQVSRTNITDFNYLPNLTKLNTQNYTSGAVIDLQGNIQLKTFDLPKLNASGLFLGRSGQLKYRSDKNGNFTANSTLLKRIGVEDNSTLVFGSPTTTPATTTVQVATVPLIKEIPLVNLLEMYGELIAVVVTPPLIVFAFLAFGILTYKLKLWQLPKKWKQRSMGAEIEQTDVYKYAKESEFHKESKKIIEESKPKIEAVNLKHRNNTTFTELTHLNHRTIAIMPGLFQEKDYRANTKMRMDFKTTDQVPYPMNDEKTLALPAEKGGLYGLAFEKKTGYPEKFQYRTQCDIFGAQWLDYKLPPVYPEYFTSTAKTMYQLPCDMIGERIEYLTDKGIPIGEFGITGQGFQAAVTVDGKDPVSSRAKQEPKDVFWLADQFPKFKIHRYCAKLDKVKRTSAKKYATSGAKNLDMFVERLVDALMNLPTKDILDLKPADVEHFVRIIQPSLFGEAGLKKNYKRAKMSAGEYVTPLNKTHVRIVGETRGDFDALRRAINIPSSVGDENHPLMQYNWVFLGNYTGRHPQSLETLMFLLALQFLYGRDCIVLLRGVMEFEDTSEEYGFKENLMARFGRKRGIEVWGWIMEIVSKLPLNCQVLYGAYCSSGGFIEDDIEGKDKDVPPGKYHKSTTPLERDKLFSLPNVTVRDYLENADTGAGYYYGERVLQKIAASTHMYTFFSTAPMMGGVGFFSDSSAAQLITISSVRHLHGHGGQKSLLAAVAEIDGDTNLITMHMILHEDEMFHYDQETEELCYGLTKGEKPAGTKTVKQKTTEEKPPGKEPPGKKTTGKKPTETTSKTNTTTAISKESAPTSTVTKSTTKPGAKSGVKAAPKTKSKTASAGV